MFNNSWDVKPYSHILDKLCKEQMKLQLIHIGEWIRFPESVHELYAHLAQFIGNIVISKSSHKWMDEFSEANGNRGLKRLSEENLEVSYAILCQIQCIYEKLKFKDTDSWFWGYNVVKCYSCMGWQLKFLFFSHYYDCFYFTLVFIAYLSLFYTSPESKYSVSKNVSNPTRFLNSHLFSDHAYGYISRHCTRSQGRSERPKLD